LFLTLVTLSSVSAVEVNAALLQDTAVVGEPVRFEIRIEGGRPSGAPNNIDVDGLSISYVGSSQSSQFSFGTGGIKTITSITYNYQIIPSRTGRFAIPALNIEVDGRIFSTKPVALRVEGNGGQSGRGATGGGATADAPPLDKISFAEIVVPKQTAYVGETLPVEFRLYVDNRINWQPESMPDFKAEGFTKTKMPDPRQEKARRDGREYDVLVFKTAITPTKAGKVNLGPANIVFNAQIPRARPNRQRSAIDQFFGQDFFNDPSFGGFGALERRKATAQTVELDVKPLPVAGKPEIFSGAVGKFTLTAEGSPREVKMGDPLTMTITVEGKGNFDRVNAPTLKETSGWRSYPPSANFRPDDDVSYRGVKTFQAAVIPETRKTQMPQFEFAYFDPDSEQYVTLTSEAKPLRVTGEKPEAGTAVRKAEPLGQPSPAPKPEVVAPPVATDILGNRYDAGPLRTFRPVYEEPAFWLAQLFPAALVAGMMFRRFYTRNDAAARVAALRRKKSEQLAKLHREKARVPFLDAAARTIQFDTALITGQEPSTVDAGAACRSRALDPETAAAVETIFNSRAEALYAGAMQDGGAIPSSERERILTVVNHFAHSHGRN
jgi:hypothetical protein